MTGCNISHFSVLNRVVPTNNLLIPPLQPHNFHWFHPACPSGKWPLKSSCPMEKSTSPRLSVVTTSFRLQAASLHQANVDGVLPPLQLHSRDKRISIVAIYSHSYEYFFTIPVPYSAETTPHWTAQPHKVSMYTGVIPGPILVFVKSWPNGAPNSSQLEPSLLTKLALAGGQMIPWVKQACKKPFNCLNMTA